MYFKKSCGYQYASPLNTSEWPSLHKVQQQFTFFQAKYIYYVHVMKCINLKAHHQMCFCIHVYTQTFVNQDREHCCQPRNFMPLPGLHLNPSETSTVVLLFTPELSFLAFHVNGIKQYVLFCVRLFALGIMFLRFLIGTSFFIALQQSMVLHNLFIHFPFSGHPTVSGLGLLGIELL